MQLLRARWLLADAQTLHEGGGVLVDGGRVQAVLAGPQEVLDARGPGVDWVDLGDVALTPGLVNAHAHLDLTALAGRVPAEGGFGPWVARLLEARAATPEAELCSGVVRGAARLVATGTTAVGDVDATGLSGPLLAAHPLGALVYREVLDAGDPSRTPAALAAARSALESAGWGAVSPHAPFTVSPALWEGLGVLLSEAGARATVHWSETEAELDYLLRGEGPLASLLGPSPHRSGLELLEAAGLLGPRTSLVHGNHPAPGEPERLARAGVTLVHCPGTHAFFDRAPAPLEAYLAAGVSVALGTDSLASNSDLDMRAELAALREAHPGLPPQVAWRMATEGGARALGLSAGRLEAGARADLAAFEVHGATTDGPGALLEELTAGRPPVRGTWVAGAEVES